MKLPIIFDVLWSLYELLFAMTYYRSRNDLQNLPKYRDPTLTCQFYSCSTICLKCCNINTRMYISLIACNVEINCLHYHRYSLAMLHSFDWNVICICLPCHMHLLALLHTFVWLKFHYSVWLPKLLETQMALLCSVTYGVNVHLREKLQQRLFFICWVSDLLKICSVLFAVS